MQTTCSKTSTERCLNPCMASIPTNLKTKINLLEHLLADSAFTRVMIFTRTRQNADNVFKFIERKKLGPVRVIHANKSQNARIGAVNQFRDGALRVLVSTDVTARGI